MITHTISFQKANTHDTKAPQRSIPSGKELSTRQLLNFDSWEMLVDTFQSNKQSFNFERWHLSQRNVLWPDLWSYIDVHAGVPNHFGLWPLKNKSTSICETWRGKAFIQAEKLMYLYFLNIRYPFIHLIILLAFGFMRSLPYFAQFTVQNTQISNFQFNKTEKNIKSSQRPREFGILFWYKPSLSTMYQNGWHLIICRQVYLCSRVVRH